MLSEPQHSPYDLRFHLFGTPVRVQPLFWLFSAILGWQYMQIGFLYLAIWIACSFVSILLHEFGHIWMGKVFGTDGYIVMYSFGGLAVGSNDLRQRWQRILVSLAGPGIQLVLWGLLWLGWKSLSPEQAAAMSFPARMALNILLFINLYWALFNLVPIWPLDGGQISREICTAASPGNGLRISLMISGGLASLLVLNDIYAMGHDGEGFIPYVCTGQWWSLILFASLAIESFQLLAAARRLQPWEQDEADDRLPWER